jgi:hypothetical protein
MPTLDVRPDTLERPAKRPFAIAWRWRGWRDLATRDRAYRLLLGALTALGLMTLAVLIRDPKYLLSRSFWLDEGWVVDSVRAPLHQLRLLTTSTPIGWTLLLRLVPPVGGPERYRLLPLAFAALTAIPAWRLGRKVSPYPWLHGLLAGIAAAASSAVLGHMWLKQYSADAFVALALLLLLARVERAWSWRSLGVYVTAGTACFLVSNTAPVVAAAGLGGLWLTALLGRRWTRLPALAAATALLGVVDGLLYKLLASGGNTPAMHHYWRLWYLSLDHGVPAVANRLWARLTTELGRLGWGPWWLAVALILVGLVALWRAGLPAVAVAQPVVLLELVVAGLLKLYPFLDARTSMFLAAILSVTAAIGLASIAGLALRHRVGAVAAVIALVATGWALVPGWVDSGRGDIPGESVKRQVAYVLEHRRPGDAVMVAYGASFSFAYYWPDRPTFVPTTVPTAVNFMPTYPGRPDLVLVHWRTDTRAGLDRAARLGRFWVIAIDAREVSSLRHHHAHQRLASPSGSLLPMLVTPEARR